MAGVRNLEPMASVDGVFVSPSSLAVALWHLGNLAHEDVQREIKDIFDKVRDANMPVGIFATAEAAARCYIEMGSFHRDWQRYGPSGPRGRRLARPLQACRWVRKSPLNCV
ncbi:hypothetical protein KYK30_18370 [Shinella yambaruensis]|uniref:Uncharacterized protein n=2 Tax=Shinella yambaruensis TaxID=415996 RepID=A0ABQ5ZL81_9HYPH|nr:hypothetical protein [Shinella yambaruensis]MCU7981663.1 hypothetical protein [Shinella yambaruensis]GLR53608.1 hypothetical protein GCM10007923_48240 [Shinella yambaruensis]